MIANDESEKYTYSTNNRIFCKFEQEEPGKGKWELGMTCPKMPSSNAYGSENAGLQRYRNTGNPLQLIYRLGKKNLADWKNTDKDEGKRVDYAACSWEKEEPSGLEEQR
ncbi:MAG: hypothetical protein GY754_21355 [bacterium]|nr:hypothetical protein [bacterium]